MSKLDDIEDVGGWRTATEQDLLNARRLDPNNDSNFVMDTIRDVARAGIGVVDTAVGLADLGYTNLTGESMRGALAEHLNYKPEEWVASLNAQDSFARQDARQAFDQAEGFVDSAAALFSNPRELAGQIVQQLPNLYGMTAAAKGAAKYGLKKAADKGLEGKALQDYARGYALAASNAAEGVLTTGSVASAIAGEKLAKGETAGREDMNWSLAAGAGTALIGRGMARFGGGTEAALGHRLATAGAGEAAGAIAGRNFGVRAGKAFLGEGGEEALQSGQEQIFTNFGADNAWDEGVAKSMGSGFALGGVMGTGIHTTNEAMDFLGRQAQKRASDQQSFLPDANASADTQVTEKAGMQQAMMDAEEARARQALQGSFQDYRNAAPQFNMDQAQAINAGQQAAPLAMRQYEQDEINEPAQQENQGESLSSIALSVLNDDAFDKLMKKKGIQEAYDKLSPVGKRYVSMVRTAMEESATHDAGVLESAINVAQHINDEATLIERIKRTNTGGKIKADYVTALQEQVGITKSEAPKKGAVVAAAAAAPVVAEDEVVADDFPTQEAREKTLSVMDNQETVDLSKDDDVEGEATEVDKPQLPSPVTQAIEDKINEAAAQTNEEEEYWDDEDNSYNARGTVAPSKAQAIATAPKTQTRTDVADKQHFVVQYDKDGNKLPVPRYKNVSATHKKRLSKVGKDTTVAVNQGKLDERDRITASEAKKLVNRIVEHDVTGSSYTGVEDLVNALLNNLSLESLGAVYDTLNDEAKKVSNQSDKVVRYALGALHSGMRGRTPNAASEETKQAFMHHPFTQWGFATSATKPTEGRLLQLGKLKSYTTALTVDELEKKAKSDTVDPALRPALRRAAATARALKEGRARLMVSANNDGNFGQTDENGNKLPLLRIVPVVNGNAKLNGYQIIRDKDGIVSAPETQARIFTQLFVKDLLQRAARNKEVRARSAANDYLAKVATAQGIELNESDIDYGSIAREDAELAGFDESGIAPSMAVATNVGELPSEIAELTANSANIRQKPNTGKTADEKETALEKSYSKLNSALSSHRWSIEEAVELAEDAVVQIVNEVLNNDLFKGTPLEPKGRFAKAFGRNVAVTRSSFYHGFITMAHPSELQNADIPKEKWVAIGMSDIVAQRYNYFFQTMRSVGERLARSTRRLDEKQKIADLLIKRLQARYAYPHQVAPDGTKRRLLAAVGDLANNAYAKAYDVQVATADRRLNSYVTSGVYMAFGKGVHAPMLWSETYIDSGDVRARSKDGLANSKSPYGVQARQDFHDYVAAKFKEVFPSKEVKDVPLAARVKFYSTIATAINGTELFYDAIRRNFNGEELNGSFFFRDPGSDAHDQAELISDFKADELWMHRWVLASGLFTKSELADKESDVHKKAIDAALAYDLRVASGLSKSVDMQQLLRLKEYIANESRVLNPEERDAIRKMSVAKSELEALVEKHSNKAGTINFLATANEVLPELSVCLHEIGKNRKVISECEKLGKDATKAKEELERAESRMGNLRDTLVTARNAAVDKKLGQVAREKYFNDFTDSLTTYVMAFFECDALAASIDADIVLKGEEEEEAAALNAECDREASKLAALTANTVLGYCNNISWDRIHKLEENTSAALAPAQRAHSAISRMFAKFTQELVFSSQDAAVSMSDKGTHNLSALGSLAAAQHAIASSIEDLASNIKTVKHKDAALGAFANWMLADTNPRDPAKRTREVYRNTLKASNIAVDETWDKATRQRVRRQYRAPVLTRKVTNDEGEVIGMAATEAAKKLVLSLEEQADILDLLDSVLTYLTSDDYLNAPSHVQERIRKTLYKNVLALGAPAYEGFSAKGTKAPSEAETLPLHKRYARMPGYTPAQLVKKDKNYSETVNQAVSHLVACGMPEDKARALVNNTRFGTLAPEDDRYGYTTVNNEGNVLVLIRDTDSLSFGERLFYVAHELCHQIFGDLGNFAASAAAKSPALEFQVVDGQVVPVGDVAKEIFQLMEKFNVIKEALTDYPLQYVTADPRTHKHLANEMLAQLGAIWMHDPAVARVLNKEAPSLGKIFQEHIGKGEFLNAELGTDTVQRVSEPAGAEELPGTNEGEERPDEPTQNDADGNAQEPVEADRTGGRRGEEPKLQHSETEDRLDDRQDQDDQVNPDEKEAFNAYSLGEVGTYTGAVRANKEAVERYDRKLAADPNNVNAPAWKRLREKALERLQEAEKGLKDAQARQEKHRAAQREKLSEAMRSAKKRDEDDDDDTPPPGGGGKPGGDTGFSAAGRIATKQAADKVFSVKETAKASIKEAVDKLPERWQNLAYKVADIANGFVGDWLKQGLLGFTFTETLAKKVKEIMPSVGRWMANRKARESWQNAQQELLSRFKDRAAAFSKPVYDQINSYLEASTLNKAWGYRPEWLPNAEVNSEMAALFNALPEEAQQFVKDTFEHNHAMLQQKFAEMSKHTDDIYEEAMNGADEKLRKTLREQWEEAKKKIEEFRPNDSWPYMPLLRRGSHAVVARSPELATAQKRRDELYEKQRKSLDTFTPEEAAELAELIKRVESLMGEPDHYIVEFVDGQGTANQRARAIEKEHPGMIVKPFPRRENMPHKGLSYYNVGVLEDALFKRMDTAMPETDQRKYISHMLATLNDIYIDSLAETHARKAQKHRLNVAGYNSDMVVNFLDQGNREIQYLANVMYSKESREAMQAMWKEAQSAETSEKAEDCRRIAREIEAREMLDFEYKPSEFVDKLQRTNSIMMLLTSPAYYLQNATQPFLMSAPYMCGRFKASQVYNHLSKDFMELGKVFVESKGQAPNLRDPKVMSKECYEALQRSRAAGNIDIGMAQDFGDLNRTTSALWRATDKLSMVARKMEMLNRVATFKTAFELAYAETKDAEAAWKYADEVLYETHGNYSSSNEPRFFKRGGLGGFGFKGAEKLIFQFRKFQLIQLGLMCRLAKDTIKGDAVARKAFAHVIGVHLAMTGLKGTPFAMLALSFMSLFGAEGDDDEDVIRELIGNKDVSDLLLGGLPAFMGVDVSERVGAGNMMSLFPFLSVDPFDGKEEANETLVALGGPTAALAVRALTGIGMMRDGEYWKGAEKLLPNGVANAMRSLRYATEGYTNSSGVVTIPEEEISAMDAFLQGIGFTPKTMTDKFRLQSKLERTQDEFERLEKRLNMDFRDAAGNQAERTRIRREYVELQKRKAEMGFKPKSVTQLMKNEKQAKKDSDNAVGGVIAKNTTRGYLEYWSKL